MFKLTPTLKDYIWGGYKLKDAFGRDNGGKRISESWEVSVHPDGPSGVDGGTLSDYAPDLPILIKYIDAAQNLSVQVHPSDEYARENEGDNGKTEMWYIISADEGAGIYCGFKRGTSREEFLRKVHDGTVEEMLNFIPVHAGDCFLIEAGTVHAICAGCVICEVQQSSNVTYRVYDYGRRDDKGNTRPLHVNKAVEVINFEAFEDRTHSGAYESVAGGKIRLLTECKYFKCRELNLRGEFSYCNDRSFVTLNVLSGSGTVSGTEFKSGDSFYVPAGEKFVIKGSGKIILSEKPDKKYYAGIDLGGTFIKAGIVDGDGNLLVSDKVPTAPGGDYAAVVNDMAGLVRKLTGELSIDSSMLEGVGIGAPGSIDSERGVIVYSNNLKWKDVPITDMLVRELGLPVRVTNDANAAALGESYLGASKGCRSSVLITLGTGVGSGIVLDGKLYEGKCSAGAEIGHTVIKAGGKKCTCGRKGCLEAYASASALIRQAKQAMKRNPQSALWKICGGDITKVDGKAVFDAVRKGDIAAKAVLDKYAEYLAAGLIDVANLLRPDMILIGGGISAAGDLLLEPLKKIFDKEVFGGNSYATVSLGLAELGNDAGIFGAARLAGLK